MILIATPTAADSTTTAFVKTLLSVRGTLQAKGLRTRYVNAIGSDIVTNRNFLASKALEDPDVSHLLFIDSDMAFEGPVVERLLSTGLPLVGCVYPKKQVDLDALQKRLTAVPGTTLADAMAATSHFVVQTLRPSPRPVGGLQRVAGVGMGATLVARTVLETMVAKGCAPRIPRDDVYRGMGLAGPAHDFFSMIRSDEGDLLSEDYSFCHRWRVDCGGEVVAVTDAAISHVGPFWYTASYQRQLDQRQKQVHITIRPA